MKQFIGFVAECQHKQIGLILDEKNGLYYGFHLSKEKFGQPWQSKNPTMIAPISKIVSSFKKLTELLE